MYGRTLRYVVLFLFSLLLCLTLVTLPRKKAVLEPGESFLIDEKVEFSVMVSGNRIAVPSSGFVADLLHGVSLRGPSDLTFSNVSYDVMHTDYPSIRVQANCRISPTASRGKKVIELSLPSSEYAGSVIGAQVTLSNVHWTGSNAIELRTIEVR